MAFEILRYGAALNQNRQQFLLNYKAEFESFEAADKVFPRLAAAAGPIPAPGEKTTFVLTPFLQTMQRQARNAFESLAACQSYQAWAALRAFVEAPLIMGKWLDDPQNAVVWLSRNSGKTARKEYQDAYGGELLKPRGLPQADVLRNLLVRLGDDFLQGNPRYYTRPPAFTADAPRPSGNPPDFADDPADHRAHTLALLHAVWFVLRATAQMLSARFGDRAELRIDLLAFERSFAASVTPVARGSEIHKNVLVHLGLWPHELLH